MAEGISEARSARGYPEWFFQLGQGEFLGIPTQLWLLIIAVVIFGIILARTRLGRALYAIGNNETGARFSGLTVNRYLLFIYTFSGFMSGVAGYIFVSRVSTTRSDMGTGIELDVIAAVVLGGTSIFGGTGSIPGDDRRRGFDSIAQEWLDAVGRDKRCDDSRDRQRAHICYTSEQLHSKSAK